MKKNKKGEKQMNKNLKNVKGLLTTTIILLFKAIYTLIKNTLYIGYLIIYNFDNLVAKLFIKLPRILRVFGVYSLVMISVIYFIGLNKKSLKRPLNEEIEDKEEIAIVIPETDEEELKELEKIEQEEIKEEKENKNEEKKCTLGEIECAIYNKGIEKGMTHKQAIMTIAISRHETGNWKSNAFKTKNNFGGIMYKGKLASYKSFDEGLERFSTLLNDKYFAKGLNTIEKIQKVYAPIGAKNDPNNLNSSWVSGVTKFYNQYLKQF